MMTNKMLRRNLSRLGRHGQGMTEYIVVASVMALSSLATYEMMMKALNAWFSSINYILNMPMP